MVRPRIWLADLVLARERLAGSPAPGDEDRIRALLGLGPGSAAPAPLPPARPRTDRPARVEPPHDTPHRAPDSGFVHVEDGSGTPPDPRSHQDGGQVGQAALAGLKPSDWDHPKPPWRDTPPLPAMRADQAGQRHLPLLRPGAARGVLHAAVSRPGADGVVDVRAATRVLATARPLVVLPRKPRPTLRHGVEVLVDHARGMEPFRRDVESLCRELPRLVGEGALSEWHFDGDPREGLDGQPYRDTAHGTVLILSTFGGPPAYDEAGGVEHWEAAVARWRARGVRPVALCPLPPRRFPPWLTRVMPVIGLDRATTVGAVRTALDRWSRR
ncbi:hypothetical protein FHX81_6918 [Saccharothrix saharensis]|uniref:Uncharacterized protein n=1 Tax=Saccharothrix saharensis TaxID=571190 RepID=A0A543JNQ3_9PSEU|nr:hypothetical protein [Saccharothrix saharensis]TQM84472.1 hypothetical protein FHX81_6918 [Saccharothrix saharensis]